MINLDLESKAFLNYYKYFKTALNFRFDFENESFLLTKINPNDQETTAICKMNQLWHAWLKRAQIAYEEIEAINTNLAKIESVEFVLLPKECPDPEFSDKLFEMLKPVCFGDVGDDAFVAVSNIDEQKVWDLMLSFAQGEVNENN